MPNWTPEDSERYWTPTRMRLRMLRVNLETFVVRRLPHWLIQRVLVVKICDWAANNPATHLPEIPALELLRNA